MPPQLAKRRPTTEERKCPYCGEDFNVRGLGRHEQACRVRHERKQQLAPVADADGTDPGMSENGMSLVHLGR